MTEVLKLSGITIYPIKSCAGVSLQSSKVVDTGFAHDREWLLIDENSNFLTQRSNAKMTLIKPVVRADQAGVSLGVELQALGKVSLYVPNVNEGEVIKTKVWESECEVVSQGEEASSWLSEFLGQKVFLTRMNPNFKRHIKDKYKQRGDEVTGFADALPFLLISEKSLEDLNEKLTEKIPMNRFRPNLVVSGGTAFQEDNWKKIKINNTTIRVVKPCARCEITTTNQETGERKSEPLETLGKYRSKPKGIMFGQNCVSVEVGDVLSVGDEVKILE